MNDIVYICSPYRAPTPEQVQVHIAYAKQLSREQVMIGHSVITPHLYYTNFLDDDARVERTRGLISAKALIRVCDLMIVGNKLGISKGMKAEIQAAHILNVPIFYEVDDGSDTDDCA